MPDVPSPTPKAIKRKGQGNAWTRFWKKVNQFDALKLFEAKRPPLVPRDIYVDLPLPVEVWEPTSKGKKQLKEGNVPPSEIERKVGKKSTAEVAVSEQSGLHFEIQHHHVPTQESPRAVQTDSQHLLLDRRYSAVLPSILQCLTCTGRLASPRGSSHHCLERWV